VPVTLPVAAVGIVTIVAPIVPVAIVAPSVMTALDPVGAIVTPAFDPVSPAVTAIFDPVGTEIAAPFDPVGLHFAAAVDPDSEVVATLTFEPVGTHIAAPFNAVSAPFAAAVDPVSLHSAFGAAYDVTAKPARCRLGTGRGGAGGRSDALRFGTLYARLSPTAAIFGAHLRALCPGLRTRFAA